MVRPKLIEGGKRRLMVTEEAYRILQQIAVIAELTGAGAAADRLALRYGELMRTEYETLNTPFNPIANVDVSRQPANERPTVRQPTAQTAQTSSIGSKPDFTNPLTAALGIF